MIIEFSVKNYRSIKDLQTLSMVAAPIKSKYPELDENNVIKISDKLSLLKSVAIYGANASGKSNLVKAMVAMIIFIRDSFKNDQIGKRIFDPFLLNSDSPNESTFFQLIFMYDNVKYRYGYEMTQDEIKSEWLFGTPDKSETYYFTRENSNIIINEKKFSEGKGLLDKTSKNNLFLNIAKAFNGSISNKIFDFITKNIAISGGLSDNDNSFQNLTLKLLEDEIPRNMILSILKYADLGIENVEVFKIDIDNFPKNPLIEIYRKNSGNIIEVPASVRQILNEKGENIGKIPFVLSERESDGTQKMFNYSGVITTALQKGNTLILDEFDARLHPMLTKKIVEMFNSPTINKNGAQLVFVTHDTNLLDNSLLRRDQIYFTEKNKMQETVLYSLADFKGIRNDASYEKDYINGKYGAIPFLGDFEKLFE